MPFAHPRRRGARAQLDEETKLVHARGHSGDHERHAREGRRLAACDGAVSIFESSFVHADANLNDRLALLGANIYDISLFGQHRVVGLAVWV